MRKTQVQDSALCEAVELAGNGLIDATLGGGVIKQRVAREGAGKSSGFRTIVLFRSEARAIFVYGFAKNDRGNISASELAGFKMLAVELLGYDDAALAKATAANVLTEVMCDGETVS